jgi:Domain of unknown function (DUF5615)
LGVLLFLADENFNNDIVRGVRRRNTAINIVRVQDVGLLSADDPSILKWAANEGRVLLTHDVTTMTGYAYDRVGSGLLMPGVFEIARHVPIGVAVEQIELLAMCSLEGEWEGQVRYLPLR